MRGPMAQNPYHILDAAKQAMSEGCRSEDPRVTKLVAMLTRTVGDTSMNSLGSTSGEYYIETSARGDLRHMLAVLPNMSMHGLAGVKKNEYPEDVNDRDDTIVELGFGADYKFYKFLVVGSEYIYNHRSSSVDGYEYSTHRALISVRGVL